MNLFYLVIFIVILILLISRRGNVEPEAKKNNAEEQIERMNKLGDETASGIAEDKKEASKKVKTVKAIKGSESSKKQKPIKRRKAETE